LLFYIFFPDFLLGIFGGDFKKGGIILSILAVGQFVNVITGSVGYLLIMCGQEKTLRNIIIFSALVTITFQLILVSEYSIMGIAIGTAIGLSLQNILATIFVKKKLNIDILKLKNGR
jgi:O-antigen/teichoic acid export membrane protein